MSYILSMINKEDEAVTIKKGDKVKTVYGNIETVMVVEDCRVVTYESARAVSWWHPTKVWAVS